MPIERFPGEEPNRFTVPYIPGLGYLADVSRPVITAERKGEVYVDLDVISVDASTVDLRKYRGDAPVDFASKVIPTEGKDVFYSFNEIDEDEAKPAVLEDVHPRNFRDPSNEQDFPEHPIVAKRMAEKVPPKVFRDLGIDVL